MISKEFAENVQGACSSSDDCGTGYDCDLSSGSCNAECVCDPATCSGSECIASDQLRQYTGCSGNTCEFNDYTCTVGCVNNADGTSTYYNGCSNGACDTGTSYECSDCQNKENCCVYYRCDTDGNNCVETGRDCGTTCPGNCGTVYETYTTTCEDVLVCP